MKNPRIDKQCQFCGRIFKTRRLRARFCSVECSAKDYERGYLQFKQCIVCGKTFAAHSANASFCSGICMEKDRREKYLADRKRRISNGIITAVETRRFLIFLRDGFRCQYCGQGPNDGKKLEVDHIFPKIKGGDDNMANLITACRECNVGKHDTIILKKGHIPSFMTI